MANTTTEETAVSNEEQEQDTGAPEGTGQADSGSADEGDADGIPAKFVNKSPLEIIRSYKELEKHAGRIGSEKAAAEQALEQERQRRAQLEAEFQNRSQQQPTNHPRHEADYDPSSVLEKHWNESPKDAIKAALGTMVNTVGSAFSGMRQQAQQAATASRWEEIQRQDPEAKKLEPVMIKLSAKLTKIVRPDQVESPEALDALYELAKASTIPERIEEGVKQRLAKKAAVTKDKRDAFTEGGNTQGDGERAFETLSREEMKKVIGVSDKY